MACGQAVGEAQRSCKRSGKPSPLALLDAQTVAVNSSSPMAASSGPWDARGMEESVTTSDGNAESLYMQGTGQEAGPRALLGRGGEDWPPPEPGQAQDTSPGAALQTLRLPQNPHSVVSSHFWTGPVSRS